MMTSKDDETIEPFDGPLCEEMSAYGEAIRSRSFAVSAGGYTHAEFRAAVIVRGGGHMDWVRRFNKTKPSTSMTAIHSPKKAIPVHMLDNLPSWAALDSVEPEVNVRWTVAERDFLVSLYTKDPNTANLAISLVCSTEFGRKITEQAIKGMLDRTRKVGMLPRYRPEYIAKVEANRLTKEANANRKNQKRYDSAEERKVRKIRAEALMAKRIIARDITTIVTVANWMPS